MDTAIMRLLRRQRHLPPTSRARRQLPADANDSEPIKDRSQTTLRKKLVKIGAKVVDHALRTIVEPRRSRRRREACVCRAYEPSK
jgi:hypothetical protein